MFDCMQWSMLDGKVFKKCLQVYELEAEIEQLKAEIVRKDKLIAHLEGRINCVKTPIEKLRWIPASERLPSLKMTELFNLFD